MDQDTVNELVAMAEQNLREVFLHMVAEGANTIEAIAERLPHFEVQQPAREGLVGDLKSALENVEGLTVREIHERLNPRIDAVEQCDNGTFQAANIRRALVGTILELLSVEGSVIVDNQTNIVELTTPGRATIKSQSEQ